MEKPVFEQGEVVFVDFPSGTICGSIVGIVSQHIIDMWIVRSTLQDRPILKEQGYDFSCFVAPSSLIRKL